MEMVVRTKIQAIHYHHGFFISGVIVIKRTINIAGHVDKGYNVKKEVTKIRVVLETLTASSITLALV